MGAIGKIVEIIHPDKLWPGEKIIDCYATIQNIGDIADNIYFYMRWEDNTGVQSVYLEPGQTTQVQLWDYKNQDWIRQSGRGKNLWVWHGVDEFDIHNYDDFKSFNVPSIGGSIKFKMAGVERPNQAPAGTELQFIVRNSLHAGAPGAMCFIRLLDRDTDEIFDYIEFAAKKNTSIQNGFSYIMPDKDWNLRCEIGIANQYSVDLDDYVEEIRDHMDFTILLGVAEGRGLIRKDELMYPEKAPQFKEFNIHLEWGNFGEIIDTIFAKIIDNDTGEILHEQRDEMQINTGRYKDIPLTMPDRDLNVRIETGHDENGIDVVDDFEEFTIKYFIPAYINIDTIPVKGQILVDGQYIGIAPTTAEVEAGTHTIIFGDVEGYRTPKSKTINIEGGDTINIIGEYLSPTMEAGFSLWLLAIPIIGGLIYQYLIN